MNSTSFFLFALGLVVPLANADGPCKTQGFFLVCEDVRSGNNLRQALDAGIRSVTIANTSENLPENLFNTTTEVNVLELRFHNLKSPPSVGSLSGLEEDLTFLEIKKGRGLSNWKWNAFSRLRRLSTFRITDSEYPVVTLAISEMTSGTVTSLSIQNSRVRCIDRHAFSNFLEVINLDLSGNEIVELKRDVFPVNGMLETLNLSQNKMISLEKYIFWDLPHLRTLYLNSNRIKRISVQSFLPRTDFYRKLFLIGNKELICDCALKQLQMGIIGVCTKGGSVYEIEVFRRDLC